MINPASILPPPMTTFLDSNGNPLSLGVVYTYVPGTSTPKTTWQNAEATVFNTNPVSLDAAGRCLLYGNGSYRFLVKDASGNTVYDQVTTITNRNVPLIPDVIPTSYSLPSVVTNTAQMVAATGASGASVSTPSVTALFALYSSYGPGAGNPNVQQGAIAGISYLSGSNTARNANTRAAFFEAVDTVGNTGIVSNPNFVEGFRAHAVAQNGVNYSQTGNVTYSTGAPGLPYLYTIGLESQVDNQYQDAPTVGAFQNTKFATSFLSSSGEPSGTFKPDAGYMTNPFAMSKFQTGFLVTSGSVADSAFASNAPSVWGLNLLFTGPIYGAIGIANNSAIRAMNAAGNAQLNLLALDPLNNCIIGSDAAIAQVGLGTTTVVTRVNGPLQADRYFTMVAITAPATPAAGQFRIYMDAADNILKAKGPGGTVTNIALP